MLLHNPKFLKIVVQVVGHHEEPGKGRQLEEVLDEDDHVTGDFEGPEDLFFCEGQAGVEDHQG
jgi:hypothetical protein